MTITGGSALPKDEIDRMIRDAESHIEDDKKKKEEADIRNTAESLIYQTEKFLADSEKELEGNPELTETIENVKKIINDLNSALAQGNYAEAKIITERLMSASQEIGSKLYAKESNNETSKPKEEATADETGVEDAEIVE